MPTTPHVETHFTASDAVRDIVIGMSDGLTVPFALAAGCGTLPVPRGSRTLRTPTSLGRRMACQHLESYR